MTKKKKILIGVGVFLVLAIIGRFLPEENTSSPEKTKQGSTKEKDIDFSNSEITAENIKSALKPVIGDDVDVEITDENKIIVTYFKESALSAKSAVRENAGDAVRICEVLYSNPGVDKLRVNQDMNLLDEKGNEKRDNVAYFETDKATVEGTNWDNMKGMVYSDRNALSNITTDYFVSRVLLKDIDE